MNFRQRMLRRALLWLLLLIAPPASASQVVMFMAPDCRCCETWVQHMREHGFTVSVQETSGMTGLKNYFGVPIGLRACHTAEVEGYVIEGHVPARVVQRLLLERPALLGLAGPDKALTGTASEAFEIIGFNNRGEIRVFAEFPE